MQRHNQRRVQGFGRWKLRTSSTLNATSCWQAYSIGTEPLWTWIRVERSFWQFPKSVMDGLNRLWTGTRSAVEPRVEILDICLNHRRWVWDESMNLWTSRRNDTAQQVLSGEKHDDMEWTWDRQVLGRGQKHPDGWAGYWHPNDLRLGEPWMRDCAPWNQISFKWQRSRVEWDWMRPEVTFRHKDQATNQTDVVRRWDERKIQLVSPTIPVFSILHICSTCHRVVARTWPAFRHSAHLIILPTHSRWLKARDVEMNASSVVTILTISEIDHFCSKTPILPSLTAPPDLSSISSLSFLTLSSSFTWAFWSSVSETKKCFSQETEILYGKENH